MRVRLSELAKMPEAERNETLRKLVEEARKPWGPEQEARHQARLRVYEDAHGMTTEEMRRKLAAGEIQETGEICSWLIFAKAGEHVKR